MNILPLSIKESYSFQKCLIPIHEFSKNAIPGCWVKIATSSGTVVLCQLFPRHFAHTIYLDRRVVITECNDIMDTDDGNLRGQTLKHVQYFKVPAVPAKEIEITFVISGKLFLAKNLNKITLTLLMDIAQPLLQVVHILPHCTVKMHELQSAGIDELQIRVNDTLPNEFYYLNEYTGLIIKDVKFVETTQNSLNSNKFIKIGFESPYKELQDILHLAQKRHKHKSGSLNTLLVGSTGSGKSTLVEQFIGENQCNCFRIRVNDILGSYPGETERQLRRKFQTVQAFQRQLKPSAPSIIFIENLDLLSPAVISSNMSNDTVCNLRTYSELVTLMDELHRTNSSIICIATTSSQVIHEQVRRPGRFEKEICINTLAAENRRKIFEALWEESYVGTNSKYYLTTEILNIVEKQTQGYVIADLKLIVQSFEQFVLHNNDNNTYDIKCVLNEIIKKSQPISRRAADVQVMRITKGFDSIGGMQALKHILQISILASLQKSKIFQRFGIDTPTGVLLYGPPGCAKTAITKCLAAETNYNFISVSGAEVYSPYVGCAEKFIAKLFDTARRNAPCILFFDEIDSLVGRRKTGASDVQIRILSTLLTEMDGIGRTYSVVKDRILIVAATNRPNMIDDALLRPGRFDKLIHVPAPDYHSRLSILQLYQKYIPLAPNVNLQYIAERTVNFSGADLCCLCNEAAINAFQCDFDATQINFKNFKSVLLHQKPSLTQNQIKWFCDFEKNLHVSK